jgi:2-dehydro-3-deoxyphosphogluconate aldolase / (4S)-4-hydroxy-2-oxoglutarate aldolase
MLRLAVARGIEERDLIPSFSACIAGGFSHLEVTMNTPNAGKMISAALKKLKGFCQIGAGTVRDMKDLENAIQAGAQFIVSPAINMEVVRYCVKEEVPVFPGALTPTEILQAWEAGATMVKVFPIRSMGGASYLKDLKGPFNEIKILASGGVTPDNLSEYVKNGVDGIAIGTQLFNPEWLEKKQYDKIREMALRFI